MTRTQYRRMVVFAIRMVKVSINGGRWKKKLREHVCEILSRMNCENSGFHYSHIIDWDNCEHGNKDEYGHTRALAEYPYDFMSDYCWNEGLEKEKEDRKGNCRTIDTKIGIALRCCIRAAMDVAVSPSGGVVGFTVQDLREMWNPKSLPKWVCDFFDPPLTAADSGTEKVWL